MSANLTNILKRINPFNVNVKYYCGVPNVDSRRADLLARGLPKVKPIPNVKDIIIVASGKGGVGKTTTAVNLAAALKSTYPEKNVGLLDTDVYGPSVPLMMALHDKPQITKKNLMLPLSNYGVKCMSMGFLINENAALVWRGLMVMQALEKLMRRVDWGPIDYLIVDTPPGTGDTHLTLIQNLPISGVILVTTPQAASIQVTKRSAMMFKKMQVPIIGVVENMSSVKCPSCMADVPLFGSGTDRLAAEMRIKVLTKVPLQKIIGDASDTGVPVIVGQWTSEEAETYRNLAKTVKGSIEEYDKKGVILI